MPKENTFDYQKKIIFLWLRYSFDNHRPTSAAVTGVVTNNFKATIMPL
jgi:hypothetical protein